LQLDFFTTNSRNEEFISQHHKNITYEKGLCPNVEDLHFRELITTDFTRSPLTLDDVQDVIDAFVKVASNLDELK